MISDVTCMCLSFKAIPNSAAEDDDDDDDDYTISFAFQVHLMCECHAGVVCRYRSTQTSILRVMVK